VHAADQVEAGAQGFHRARSIPGAAPPTGATPITRLWRLLQQRQASCQVCRSAAQPGAQLADTGPPPVDLAMAGLAWRLSTALPENQHGEAK
jgi:hypothetical protein